MMGRIAIIGMLAAALAAGIALWILQVFVEYERFVGPSDGFGPVLKLSGQSSGIRLTAIEGIRGTSSPLKFRACFKVEESGLQNLAEASPYDSPQPLTAPDWFDCYDAETLGTDLEAGHAKAFLVQADFAHGVDLVAAFYPDGRGFVWRQINMK